MSNTSLLLFAALALTQTTYGQQAETPKPQPAPPCQAPKPQDNHGIKWNPQNKPNGRFDKLRQKLEDKTGVHIPSADEMKKDAEKQNPCPPADKTPVSKTTTVAPLPASPTPAAPAPQSKPGTILVCPPKATLIAGHPYCIFPDHTVVDAMEIPSAPQPQTK